MTSKLYTWRDNDNLALIYEWKIEFLIFLKISKKNETRNQYLLRNNLQKEYLKVVIFLKNKLIFKRNKSIIWLLKLNVNNNKLRWCKV